MEKKSSRKGPGNRPLSNGPKFEPEIRGDGGRRNLANLKTMSTEQVMAHFEISRATLYRWTKCGRLPEPLKFGRSSRWLAAEVAARIQERIEARDSGGQA